MSWVAILMGSESDWPIMRATTEILERLGVDFEAKITSAHRTPQATMEYVLDAQRRGCDVFVCAAGLAAHLAGAVVAHTVKPVIGVPVDSGPLSGFDALLSTVQMPGGIPVATVAVGKTGAKNAAYLAAQILAVSDEGVAEKLRADREENGANVNAQNERLQKELSS
ncbi:MAG: 5-(carboxyamino)imidazole ribonucleotide mutase [Gammaproteobacteria bacterium]|nr:5-(carboxyamino)imidazole ribonucleotide mutase [Gammaproteobacteria bacterium]